MGAIVSTSRIILHLHMSHFLALLYYLSDTMAEFRHEDQYNR